MYTLRILDRDPETQLLISLGQVIELLEKAIPNFYDGDWELCQGAYAGYGEYVCSLEDHSKLSGVRISNTKELFSKLVSGEEYFYHVRFKKGGLEFGLVDSTFLYISMDDDAMLALLQNRFHCTEKILVE